MMTSLTMLIKHIDVISNLSMLPEYFKHTFVRNALIASVLIAISAALVGVFLVLKRYSALGDGLSHVAFGAAAIAATLDILDIGLTIPITVLAAILILKTKRERRVMGDAVIALVSISSLAIGYTVLGLGGGASNLGGDVCTALFGSSAILSVDTKELFLALAVTGTLIALILTFYHKLLSVSFDENFSLACGTKTGIYNTAIAISAAIVIVIGMKLSGALLISALIVFPALSAMRITRGFGRVLIVSAITGALCATVGVLASIAFETPIGATIAAVDVLIYALFSLISKKK